MVDATTIFNDTGKIPSDADFWSDEAAEWASADGITSGFSRVIGEQVFRPVDDPLTPMYNVFAGRPITSGKGWSERISAKTPTYKFNPKATAQDDLGFYDSSGLEFLFEVDYEGRKSVSLPSELASLEMFLQSSGVGQLNSILVDQVLADYQRDMESAIEMKAVSTTEAVKTLTQTQSEDPQQILKLIQQTATEMRGTKVHYNELEDDQNEQVYTNSRDVLVFMGQSLYDDIMDSFANLPNPDRIVRNATIIPMVDGLPTPITTTQFNEGVKVGDDTITTWTPSTKPVAADQPAPLVWMCARNRIEVRPLASSYRVNLTKNGAGDFQNEHLLWKCAIAVKPFENAVRINDYVGGP